MLENKEPTGVSRAERPPVIKISQAAAAKIHELVASRNTKNSENQAEHTIGIRVGVSKRGCAGLEYVFEFAEESMPGDNVIEENGVKVLVNKRDEFYLIGTTLNYVMGDEYSGFSFDNPNEKGRCGCGESFYA